MRATHLTHWFGALAVLALGGCGGGEMNDLKQYVASVLARAGGEIEPLPAIKPYERYLYQSAEKELRNPFVEPIKEPPKAETGITGTDSLQDKFNDEIRAHNSEELEAFELDSLRMVGTLQNDTELWAIVKDTTGTVHRIKVGNYIGRNFGKVLEIKEDRLELREIAKNGDGRWEERNASLALAEQGTK